jgi:hypothetical protein
MADRTSTHKCRKTHFDWKIPKGARVTDWDAHIGGEDAVYETGGEWTEAVMGDEEQDERDNRIAGNG